MSQCPVQLSVQADTDAGRAVLGPEPGDSGFTATLTRTAGPAGRDRVTIEVTRTGPEPAPARIVISATVPGTEVPFWMIPGLFYGDNRPDGCARVFPAFRTAAADHAGLVSDHWAFRADRCATPAVFAWTEAGGVALACAEHNELGLAGLGFSYLPGGSSVHLSFPYAERPVSYRGQPYGEAPLQETYRWRPGEHRSIRVDTFQLSPDRHGHRAVLRALHADAAEASPLRPWVGLAAAAELAALGLYRWHYHPEHGALYETAAFERDLDGRAMGQPDRPEMHVAWISGIPYAHALARHGHRVENPDHLAAGIHVIDTICANLAPCGSFWGRWSLQRGWTQSWTPVTDGLHARTMAEAALFTARALASERAAGRDHPHWEVALRGTLALAIGGLDAEGNPGSMYHARTGAVLASAGAAGLTWAAALAEASQLLTEPSWLATAESVGRYYARFVHSQTLCGAPEDVDLAPTSEDGVAAVLAYMALFRLTGSREWLDLAREGADWMLTFRYTYNTAFDPHTLLGSYGFATRGADQASPANQHLHGYGLMCTAEMVELSRACADPHYAQRAAETLACLRQFIARTDGDFNARKGMTSERYYQTECFQPKGMLLTLSHSWSLGVLLLAAEDALTLPELTDDVRPPAP